ncbi:formyltransferase family protein [Rhodococcus sp. NPDC058521]|uniref:formyltransferase family protein n=1 Tax=Rhodococcus sp. NPDC058521 TaxID=3346536 RepID=UPI00365F8E82
MNTEFATIETARTDDVVWSVNNATILKAPLIGSGMRIYNIHNGLLPGFRGRPEIAIVHAILAGENTYGATLHEVDAGIDTGRVVDVETFDICPDDRFQEVMMAGIKSCHVLFERNLDAVVSGHPEAVVRPGASEYYGLDRIRTLDTHRDDPNFERATALGVFSPLYPEIAKASNITEQTVQARP